MLPEIQEIERLIAELGPLVRHEVLATVPHKKHPFPIYKLSFGSESPDATVVGMVGGVHGLERIGSQVCLSLLRSLSERLLWDQSLQESLKNLRLFFIPVVNPVGIFERTRSNGNGVDLMRNAPVDADKPPRYLGGHRISPRLPWFRGALHAPLEIETQALVDAVFKEIKNSRTAITVDFHSGFGLQDQIWFPYAKTQKAYPGLSEAHAFKSLFDRTYPHHFYRIEPQALNYTTHGDLWDHLYDEHRKLSGSESIYLPLCLEMGSWLWVKKNPLQFFQRHGIFNPIKSHRLKRTLRRHNTFFDFVVRAAQSPQAWAHLPPEQKQAHWDRAQELWYT